MRRHMAFMITTTLIVLITALALPDEALAWGIGAHLSIAERITDALTLAGPYRHASIITSNPAAFMIGSILPDIHAIRNWFLKPRREVHGWAMAKGLISSARTEQEMSLALGYAAHLSSDVICHNFLIPQFVFFQERGPKFAHFLAESRADGYIGRPELLEEAENFLGDRRLSDFFLTCSGISRKDFDANISVLRNAIRLKRKTAIDSLTFRLGNREAFVRKVEHHLDLSVTLSVKAIAGLPGSLPIEYCPEGERRIRLSSLRRKLSRKQLSTEEFKKGLLEGRFEYMHRVPPALASA